MPEVDVVQIHLEPLTEAGRGRRIENDAAERDVVRRIVREVTGKEPRELRFLKTDDGLLAYVTLRLDPSSPLPKHTGHASEIEERTRRARPDIAEVIVHTEPAR